jgi:hypothetical protein
MGQVGEIAGKLFEDYEKRIAAPDPYLYHLYVGMRSFLRTRGGVQVIRRVRSGRAAVRADHGLTS